MIKSFDSVYKELEYLFIQKLPEYIDKINKRHNDGIILKPFANINLIDECLKLPCFKFSLEEAEYTEKDRIIENSVFNYSMKIKTDIQNKKLYFWRYTEAFRQMIEETEITSNITEFRINKITDDKIIFRIVL